MDRRFRRIPPAWPLWAAVLACAVLGAEGTARGQAAGEPARKAGAAEAADARAKAKAQAPRREPSKEYRESIRKTVEQRRRRRARRAQGQGSDDLRPVGAIVPWPLPPALIIRQTPQVHDEVGSLLGQLRRGG